MSQATFSTNHTGNDQPASSRILRPQKSPVRTIHLAVPLSLTQSATPFPHWLVDCPTYQRDRDQFEEPDLLEWDRLDDFQDQVCEAYRGAQGTWFIRSVVAIAITHYGTQQAVADRIDLERSSISVAKDHGELGSRPLACLLVDSAIQARLQILGPILFAEIAREAFMASAKVAINWRPGLNPADLTHERYEAICRAIEARAGQPLESNEIEENAEMQRWYELFAYVFATVEDLLPYGLTPL